MTAFFEEFGVIRAQIAWRIDCGFAMNILANADQRRKLAAKISWVKKRAVADVPDKREHKRTIPRDPSSTLTLADGTTIPCFVIDVSRSGVAVSAELNPEIGTPLAVGKVVGRVVRRLEIGFAVQFLQIQGDDLLESIRGIPHP